MPIYEFYSPDTNKIYTFYARSLSMSGKIPRCPDGDSHTMEKVPSRFAFVGRAKEPATGSDENFDDPHFEETMAEMEKAIADMDENNPDPRQMGQMMRKMMGMSGQQVPDVVEEMIGRMEAGEDPDSLEEEYGDALDDDSLWGDDDGDAPIDRRGRLRAIAKMRRPVRDPSTYEMADYV
ncbi:MAG: cytochrome C [Verrucomicrobiota bacterium]